MHTAPASGYVAPVTHETCLRSYTFARCRLDARFESPARMARRPEIRQYRLQAPLQRHQAALLAQRCGLHLPGQTCATSKDRTRSSLMRRAGLRWLTKRLAPKGGGHRIPAKLAFGGPVWVASKQTFDTQGAKIVAVESCLMNDPTVAFRCDVSFNVFWRALNLAVCCLMTGHDWPWVDPPDTPPTCNSLRKLGHVSLATASTDVQGRTSQTNSGHRSCLSLSPVCGASLSDIHVHCCSMS